MARPPLSAEDRRFLDSYDPSDFERPSVAVDVALITVLEGSLHALAVRRPESPYKGRFALPGGFLGMKESLDQAAARVLADKAGLEGLFIEQLYTFGAPRRDPRTRVLSVAYYALVSQERMRDAISKDQRLLRLEVPWEGEAGGAVLAHDGARKIALAFDHDEILGMAIKRLRGKLNYAPVGYQLLGETFTLRQLQEVHEAILGQKLLKPPFRRRMLASGDLVATGEFEAGTAYRPAELYRFADRADLGGSYLERVTRERTLTSGDEDTLRGILGRG